MNDDLAITTGDLHIRNRKGSRDLALGIQLLRDLECLATDHKTRTIILNGDVWDQKDSTKLPELDVLTTIYRELVRLRTRGFRVVWIRGNHESPLRTHPTRSLMSLFSRVCTVVLRPTRIRGLGWNTWLLPWYPGPTFRKLLGVVGKAALTVPGKRYIIAHIGIKEGVVSPSNYRVNQEVSIYDFGWKIWDMALLSDYHAHQSLASSRLDEDMFYLGAPRPQTFGDFSNLGAWLVNFRLATAEPLALPSIYPAFETYEVKGLDDLPLDGYSTTNFNRIRVVEELRDHVRRMYPEARLISLEGVRPTHAGRIETEDRNNSRGADDPVHVFKILCKEKKWTPEHVKLGLKYLKEAI